MAFYLLQAQRLGNLAQVFSCVCLFGQEIFEGADQLVTSAVADCNVDVDAGVVFAALLCGAQLFGNLVGQEREIADDFYAVLCGQRIHQVDYHVQKRQQDVFLGALQVIGGKYPKRHNRDVDLLAPVNELAKLIGACLVANLEGLTGRVGSSPPPVSVCKYCDVLG